MPRKRNHDVILTGIPRSGSTLVCFLLNKLDNTIALHEPMDVVALARNSSSFADGVQDWLNTARKSLLANKVAVSRQRHGSIPDNPVESRPEDSQLRKVNVTWSPVRFEKALTEDFLLAIKHPAVFTAILPELVKAFTCFATVRNPLATLASWNSVAMKVGEGRSPVAELYDPGLAKDLDRIGDPIDRQLHLLSWMFERYLEYLPEASVIYYEELVRSSGRSLFPISDSAESLNEVLECRNTSQNYRREVVLKIGERLLSKRGAYWEFYDRSQVEDLLSKWESIV